ncbi:hypothetical protein [Bacillus sp. S/N-304-OC-R1]|uniref:hypothetical protein n=1 Tax=Bacillus sp. S/N-304-OC-R1 TaxID=2758034 RepID=UPI001C8DF059|nr:hypothetical protein [Bacillus sp. S/N-304-OC-R1]MBY0121756.1 hypothetical protein [Bacillus sp. S/N-304-OC-R1]
MKGLDAEYFYRPAEYTVLRDERKIKKTSLEEYIKKINPNFRYWLITPDVISAIQSFSNSIVLGNGKVEFEQNEIIVTIGNERYAYDLEEYNPITYIHTDVYEDPYAHFSVPVPSEEIEAAIFGSDLELQVRAWNTLYANPIELIDIINRVLSKITITEENEMMVSVFTSHFYKLGILKEAVIEKFQSLID